MGKKITILLLITLCSTSLFGQVNYLDYHKKRCEIIEVLVSENFAQSSLMFDTLFGKYPFVFTQDYVIAAQVSAANNQPLKAIYFLEKAMKQGFNISCALDCLVFKNTVILPEWYDLVAKKDSLKAIYRASINQELSKEFVKRYRLEQDSKSKEHYKQVVYSNFNRIKEIIDSVGFPNERMIGIDDASMDASLEDCDIDNARIIPTLLHYDYAFSELEPLLYKALENGFLRPSEMGVIYAFERKKVSKLYGDSTKKGRPIPDYQFGIWDKITDINKANNDRAKFGMLSIEVGKKVKPLAQKYGMRLSFGY